MDQPPEFNRPLMNPSPEFHHPPIDPPPEFNRPLMVPPWLQNPQWLRVTEWPSIYRSAVISFRAIALILLFLAAQRIGAASQEITISSLSLGTVSYSDYTAYIYFMSINIIACISSGILLAVCLYQKDNIKWIQTLITSFDIVMIALLFSAIGAAFSVYTISYNGLSVQIFSWVVMCGTLSTFCSQVASSLGVSICGSVAYMIAIVLNNLNYWSASADGSLYATQEFAV